jgi:hypothetical protein
VHLLAKASLALDDFLAIEDGYGARRHSTKLGLTPTAIEKRLGFLGRVGDG